jgi:hypothetical protein
MVQKGDRIHLTGSLLSVLSRVPQGLSGVMIGFYESGGPAGACLQVRLDRPFSFRDREYTLALLVAREEAKTWSADSGHCLVFLLNLRSKFARTREGLSDEWVRLDGNAKYSVVRDRFRDG